MRQVTGFLWFGVSLFALQTALFGQGSYMAPNRPAVNPLTGESNRVEVADFREDLSSLEKTVKELQLRVEELEREKNTLQEKLKTSDSSLYATRDELKLAEARLKDSVASESKKVQENILAELKAAKTQVAPTPAAVVAENKPAPAPLNVSETEKARYMKEGVRHTVSQGDTLSSIARRYGSSMRAIRAVNDIPNPDKLFVGTELFIPTSIHE